MTTALVIPTCRPADLQAFFDAWGTRGGWDQIIIVEDRAHKSAGWKASPDARTDEDVLHYAHTEIDAMLQQDAWIIPRRNSGIRIFGFLVAWWLGCDAVLTLDDDCYPEQQLGFPAGPGTLAERHGKTLAGQPRWVEAIPGLRTRGLPYRQLGHVDYAKVNVGLWTNNPDLDGPCSLIHGALAGFQPPRGSRLIPAGQLAPLCGMNVFAERAAIPLLFQPPMGQDEPYDRFEDIWGGIILKRICDRLGWAVAMGEPFVEHRRASDPFVNLRKEAAGIGANEHFWQRIVAAPLVQSDSPIVQLEELGRTLTQQSRDGNELGQYLRRVGNALMIWARLFRTCPAPLMDQIQDRLPCATSSTI